MDNFEDTILVQYEHSPRIVQLITNWNDYIDSGPTIESFFLDVFNLATAVGFGLDIWGVILGISRTVQVGSFRFFGFHGPIGNSGTGFNVGVFATRGVALTSSYDLPDNQYRILLFAKAAYNVSDCSIPSLNQMLVNLFGPNGILPVAGNSYITDGRNMTMTYNFGSQLSLLQSAIANSGILPKPGGVQVSFIND